MVDNGQQCRCYFGILAVEALDRYRNKIERALLRSGERSTWRDVVDGVLSGHMQIWPNGQSCIVTQLCVYPKEKSLRVFLAAGKADEILPMTRDVAEWAKSQGCQTAEFEGRLGWEKPLSEIGWRKRCVVMQLDLGKFDGREKHVED